MEDIPVKYLVLGSSGQIGSALTNFLIEQKQEVLEFDIVRSPQEDLRIPRNKILRQHIMVADFVFFLAFDVGGSRYLKTYEHTFEFLSNNARLMSNTFELLRETRKPFIFASSQMSNMSFSPYGLLKALGENYTRSLSGLIVKFWNVYGIEHDFAKAHVITDFILKARDNRCIDMVTDGTEERQFLYADDCSECLHLLSQSYDTIDRKQELHITSFEWANILEVAKIIAEFFPKTVIIPAEFKDDVQKGQRNEPDAYILQHWKPRTSLRDGIERIMAYTIKTPLKDKR
jgi:nucleoside-diphosphate-sugar epimerase